MYKNNNNTTKQSNRDAIKDMEGDEFGEHIKIFATKMERKKLHFYKFFVAEKRKE